MHIRKSFPPHLDLLKGWIAVSALHSLQARRAAEEPGRGVIDGKLPWSETLTSFARMHSHQLHLGHSDSFPAATHTPSWSHLSP